MNSLLLYITHVTHLFSALLLNDHFNLERLACLKESSPVFLVGEEV